MIPVWIINLAQKNVDRIRLEQLYNELTGTVRSYWFYTELDVAPMTDEVSCSLLLNSLIMQGRECFNHFQKKGFVVHNLQICVIGTITEPLTRTSFHLIASLLKEFMPSIQSGYVHRGVEITGLLFIPHNINQASNSERVECALFMEEMNTLTGNQMADTYNRVVVCQDIQRPDIGERFYGGLNDRQQAEYVFQVLLHLYYCSDTQPKVFDSPEVQKPGYYSLGVASVYYDSREHKERKAFDLLAKITGLLKDPSNASDSDAEDMATVRFPLSSMNAETILNRLKENCQGLGVDLKTLEAKPNPHPVMHFYNPRLYLSYYLDYLKFMPARALEFTRLYTHLLTGKLFGQIEKNNQQLQERFKGILYQYDHIFIERDYPYPTFPQLKAALEKLKLRFKAEKEQVEKLMIREERVVFDVPAYLSVYYNRFKADETEWSEKKIASEIKDELKGEPTVMSVLNRCFLLGTVMVFVLMPLLRYISPFIINLGDIDKWAGLWITFIFASPFLYQGGIRLQRHFRRVRNLKRMLLARSLVQVQQKASAMLYKQTINFYNEMLNACNEAIRRYGQIEELLQVEGRQACQPEAPETFFNQPLIEGVFNRKKMLLKPDMIGDDIVINGLQVKLSEIKPDDYFTLLKEIIRNPGACVYKISGDPEKTMDEAAKSCLEKMGDILRNRLKINEETCAAKVINEISRKNDDAMDLSPLFGMAGINGVITDSTSEKGTLIRSYHKLDRLPKNAYAVKYIEKDEEAKSFLFVTTWSRPYINKLDAKSILDTEMRLPDATLPFSVRLTCLYAQYKKKDNNYYIGERKVPLTTESLQQLEFAINKMKP